MNIALIIAGGVGVRMKQEIPKQFLSVYDKPIIAYTLEAFQLHPDINIISVVCVKGWETVIGAYGRQYNITKLKHIEYGGESGLQSIRNGLYALEKVYSKDDIVLIHDAIRPMVSHEIISNCIVTTQHYGNATVVIPCAEAMLETTDRMVSNNSYPRERLVRTQTPQGFKLGTILAAHKDAERLGIDNSIASCTLMIETGREVYFSPGSEKNIKLTTYDDIEIFKALLKSGG